VSALKLSEDRNLGRFGSLLLALLAIFAAAPFAGRTQSPVQILSLAFSAVLLAGVYSVSQRRRVLYVAIAIAAPTLAFEWISNYHTTTFTLVTNLVLLGVFVAFVAAVVLVEVLEEDRVSLDTIFGGIAIYLLIGLGWAIAFSILEHLEPGSYPFAGQALQEIRLPYEFVFPELLYFSFVTLTTLGYGDMTPATQPARALAVSEAMAGQLFVAIFIARLVALHITHAARDRSRD